MEHQLVTRQHNSRSTQPNHRYMRCSMIDILESLSLRDTFCLNVGESVIHMLIRTYLAYSSYVGWFDGHSWLHWVLALSLVVCFTIMIISIIFKFSQWLLVAEVMYLEFWGWRLCYLLYQHRTPIGSLRDYIAYLFPNSKPAQVVISYIHKPFPLQLSASKVPSKSGKSLPNISTAKMPRVPLPCLVIFSVYFGTLLYSWLAQIDILPELV